MPRPETITFPFTFLLFPFLRSSVVSFFRCSSDPSFICRNSSFSAAKLLYYRHRQLDTLISLYVSDSIVSFILNRIVSIDPMTTPPTTIQQFPSLSNWIVDLSDRPLPCVNNYHITLKI